MGYTCDYCTEERSMVYCRSDAAFLCLSCDRNVHSANAISQRHSRTMVCERCYSQPSFVRCIEERISLCQNCDWIGHSGPNSASAHKRETVKCYSGCPSAAELSTIWSFLLDLPSTGDTTCEQGTSSMTSRDNIAETLPKNSGCNNNQNVPLALEAIGVLNAYKKTTWVDSPMPDLETKLRNDAHKPAALTNSAAPKISFSGITEPGLPDDDAFYKDLNLDEVDLTIENYEELFGTILDDPDLSFGNDEIDTLFGMNDVSADGSNCQAAYIPEESSIRLVSKMPPACSLTASTDCKLQSKAESNICFARQTQSNLSFSGLTGESIAGDCQDCGVSSIQHLMGEPPWCTPCPDNSFTSASRSNAVMRYKEKKKTRKFDRKVRYASRKARADIRKRVKGRFVKAGDAYDYDPLNQLTSV